MNIGGVRRSKGLDNVNVPDEMAFAPVEPKEFNVIWLERYQCSSYIMLVSGNCTVDSVSALLYVARFAGAAVPDAISTIAQHHTDRTSWIETYGIKFELVCERNQNHACSGITAGEFPQCSQQ